MTKDFEESFFQLGFFIMDYTTTIAICMIY